jgi:hypothetical protein
MAVHADGQAAQVDPIFDIGSTWPWRATRTPARSGSRATPTSAATARCGTPGPALFGVAAQYTWSLLFAGMDAPLPDAPAERLDYWQEASSRWDWTRAKLEGPALESLIAAAGGAP